MEMAAKPWHLVQISDGLNSSTVAFLKRQQIELYRPLIRTMKPVPRDRLSRSQRKAPLRPMHEKIEPFFPGYAFIDFSESGELWREIFKMVHIRGLVCAGNLPVRVPFALIEQIQGREIDGAVPGTTPLREFTYLIGENVRIVDGPLASFAAIVEELPNWADGAQAAGTCIGKLDESDRVKLLVNIFGRQTPVRLSVDQIEKV
jgi:transcriptional antiterminator NusG